ncbi:MAG TPA: hypothetical protein VL284_11080 [Thermoanaerobaculia bacterium]|nr:hypothetical protein [Thermoanaerobaculia bacterium]
MGTHLIRDGFFGIGALVIAVYCFVSARTVMPSRGGDLFESIAWGKLVVGLVYAGMAMLFFWMWSRGM